MVAMSIFLMIGGMMLMALRSGVDTWSRTEEQRQIFEDAQTLLRQMRQDLTSLVSTGSSSDDPRVLLICDFDRNRRQRIRFVRSIKAEDQKTLLRLAGAGTPDEGFTEYLTEKDDLEKKLQPLGGLMEVAYLFDPDDPDSTVLYRGVRAPLGGEGSLFVDENLSSSKKVRAACNPVSLNVLFLGFTFWTQYTTTWDPSVPIHASLGGKCGPEISWDSSRGILPLPGTTKKKNDPNVFSLARNEASRAVVADDIFPRQIQVSLVLRPRAGQALRTTLRRDISSGDRNLFLDAVDGFPDEDDPDLYRYVKIDQEWIHYRERSGREISADRRGARGSRARGHKAGAAVETGRTFVATVGVPAYREYWFGENPASALSKGR
jgi:hypothetical protein